MIRIRVAEMEDLDTVLAWENDPALWAVTDQPGPFTRAQILQFILRSQEISDDLQQRWMIVHEEFGPVGCIDLFDYDETLREVGIGITIAKSEDRRKGYARSALQQMLNHLRDELHAQRVNCLIHPTNTASIQLFITLGFRMVSELTHRGKLTYRYVCKLD